MSKKFIKPEYDKDLNPVDYWNYYGDWHITFDKVPGIIWITDVSIASAPNEQPFLKIEKTHLEVLTKNKLNLTPGKQYTKFMILAILKFNGSYRKAISHIEMKYLNKEIPYIRVGIDYFKIITKTDRYGIPRKIVKGWNKSEMIQDHGKAIINSIHLFDDFCIEPDNLDHDIIHDNCYNLYAEFSHKPASSTITEYDIPISIGLLKHIFGEQYELGLKYLKILYELPKQALPILCLVSQERQTGKTTFLNWMNIIFGDNFTQINPEELHSSFNSSYAHKNVIAIDETVVDKSQAVEKLKSLVTSKTISVNQKFVANYSIPFFGKVIICTNKENDFIRVDQEEIRFWIRKIHSIERINTLIEQQLADEVPALLKFLMQLPAIDATKSRMVFTIEELENDSLTIIKNESWSGLRKELTFYINDYFSQNEYQEFYATPMDLKKQFFNSNNNISINYIAKVLRDEMKMEPEKIMRYRSFNKTTNEDSRVGMPYIFKRNLEILIEDKIFEESDEMPF